MTNREYLQSLSDEDFVNAIYDVLIHQGKMYTQSRLGLTDWLSKQKGQEWEMWEQKIEWLKGYRE